MDLLIPKSILSGLYTRVIGNRLIYLMTTASTMDEADRHAKKGAGDGTVIIAENQTDARGRFRRQWISNLGNLYVSVILRPVIQSLPYISMMSSIAVVRALNRISLSSVSIKWPNDVMINGKKVSGILVENTIKGNILEYCVVGVGINVDFDAASDPLIGHTATSLNVECGRQIDRNQLAGYLLEELDYLYTVCSDTANPLYEDHINNSVLNEWKELLNTLGKNVRVKWNQDIYSGYAETVDSYGNLILRMKDNSTVTLPAGEVTTQMS